MYMKIWSIIKEDFEGKSKIDEGWKENILATIMGLSTMFGSVKAQDKSSDATNLSVSQQVGDNMLKLDIGKIFKSGRYRFNPKDNQIFNEELRKFGKEIQKNPTSEFTIQIVSSESRVTNYDMEETSPTYGKPLAVGDLAKKRAETVNFILTTFATQLKKEGVLKGDVKFVEPKILIGDVPWPSLNPETKQRRSNDDAVYTKDQFVVVNIKIGKPQTTQVTPPPVDPYAVYADMGEGIYYNNQLFAMAFEDTRFSDKIDKSGNKDAGYQNVLFKTVKPNTQVIGKKDEKNVYTGTYLIPWQWWNSKTGTTHTLTPEIVDYIIKNFKVK